MIPIIALAGIGGTSTGDELLFDSLIFMILLLKALFVPMIIFPISSNHSPIWMIVLQPILVLCGLVGVHLWLRSLKIRRFKRIFLYVGAYCLLTFSTNAAGGERGVFSVGRNIMRNARHLVVGDGWSRDTRP
jgi:hypothetical protein